MAEITGRDPAGNLGTFLRERVTSGFPVITTDHGFIHEGIAYSLSTALQFGSSKTGGIKFTTPKTTNTKATVTTNITGTNRDIVWTAKRGGTAGNAIDIIYVNPNTAAGAALGAVVAGNEITFNLANSAAAKATKTIAGMLFTAKTAGTAGNSITVTITDPAGNNAALGCTVSGSDITVSLATGATSVITSTIGQVIAKIAATTAAAALVDVTPVFGNATQAVAVTQTSLEGGTAGAAITTTANDILALAASQSDVAALVTGALETTTDTTNDGTGAVTAMGKIDLAGGLNGAYVHFKPTTFTANNPCTVSIEEDTSFSDTGTGVTPFNRNRNSTNTSTMTFLYDLDATVTTGAGAVTLDKFYLPAASSGANKVGSSANAAEELVLKPETNYLIKVVNSANTTDTNINLFWYEESSS